MKGRSIGASRHDEVPLWGTMWLLEQWRGGRTLADIATELGVHENTVQRWKGQHGHQRVGS